jgi:uncharacterized cupredoxin-like copper-binding protein
MQMQAMSTSKRLSILATTGLLALVASSAALAGVTRHTVTAKAAISQVTVTFKGQQLGVSSTTLDAGTTTFVVVNKGKTGHILAISGPGLKGVHTAKLAAGHSAKLTVKLRKGSYMLSDPALGAYQVQYLSILPAANVSATGTSSVVLPPITSNPNNAMCGTTYTP